MSKKNLFSSKNVAEKIFQFFVTGKTDLAINLLKDKSLDTLRGNIIATISKKLFKQKQYFVTKIFSQTEIDKEVLALLEKKNIDTKEIQIIKSADMGPGIVVKSMDTKIDATLASMLEEKIRKILT